MLKKETKKEEVEVPTEKDRLVKLYADLKELNVTRISDLESLIARAE